MKPHEKLIKLIKPIEKDEASEAVTESATIFPDFLRVYTPNHSYLRNKPGIEPIGPRRIRFQGGRARWENIERSVRRSKRNIKDYALNNKFELFVTFTFAEDRQNNRRTKTRLKDWIKNQKKRVGSFEYLVVSEFHQDGESLHFHALLSGYKGRVKRSINIKTGKPLIQKGREIFELPSFTHGFTSVIRVDDDPESQIRTANYIGKYLTKSSAQLFGQNRYWVSRGLAKPTVIHNPKIDYTNLLEVERIKTDYGMLRYFICKKTGQ